MITKTCWLFALLLVLAAPSSFAAVVAVDIADFQFAPQIVTVKLGDTIQWVNKGPSIHTTTSDTGIWNSGNMIRGQSFSRVFGAEASFNFHCALHPAMRGTIVVSGAEQPQPIQPSVGLNGSLLAVSLNAGASLGQNADWWLVAMTPWGHWYYYTYPNTWVDIGSDLTRVAPAHQGPLANISGLSLFDTAGIPSGTYVFYFGVDTNMNGALDNSQLHYSSFSLTAP